MKSALKKYLLDALNACQAIQAFVSCRSWEDYEHNLMLRSAVERQFEIVGEALHRAELEEPAFDRWVPQVRRIVGLRNRIIHGYDSVDDELLWQTITLHVPPLVTRLEQILENGPPD